MAKSNAVATVDTASKLPAAMMDMYEEEAGSGFETADSSSYAIPFLQVLQALSPQCDAQKGEYLEDAKPGMIFNTVTKELMDGKKGIIVIPVNYKRTFIEWVPRKLGGGFAGEYIPGDPYVDTAVRNDETSRDELPNGNDLMDTRTHYCLQINASGEYDPAVISLSSTQIKKSKEWMAKMGRLKHTDKSGRMFTLPMFAGIYRLSVVGESNNKGSWFGWKIESMGLVDDKRIFDGAKDFRDMIQDGAAKVDYNTVAEGDVVDSDVEEF